MKNNLSPLVKITAFSLMLLSSRHSFSQQNVHSSSDGYTPPALKKADSLRINVKRNILCFGFFSPLNQHISFEYDRLLGEDLVLSSQIGLIGPGVTKESSGTTAGGFIEAGMKLFFHPDFVMDGMHRYNVMQGGYFKPQIIVSVFNNSSTGYYNTGTYSNYYYQQTTVTNSYIGVALMLNIGHQYVIAHSVVLDWYVGMGYNLNNSTNTTEPAVSNYYSYLTFGSTFPLAVAAGLNIGLPF